MYQKTLEEFSPNSLRHGYDDFQEKFSDDFTEFFKFLLEREKNSEWIEIPVNKMYVLKLNDSEFMMKIQGFEDIKELVSDTKYNLNLVITLNDKPYLVGATAYKTLLDRARISGSSLSSLTEEDLSTVLNLCLATNTAGALVKIQDHKIRALHSEHYKIIKMTSIFLETSNYISENYINSVFVNAFHNHLITSGLWELRDNDVISEYINVLERHSLSFGNEIKPMIRVTTSDIGINGANIYPVLKVGKKNIRIGSTLKLNHKSDADIEKFKENLELLFAQGIKDGILRLTKLLDIKINNPVNCMTLIMRNIGLNKKQSLDTIDLFRGTGNIVSCTAHEIFYAISEIVPIVYEESKNTMKTLEAEECVERALMIDWKKYDISGGVTW